jgi:DNA-binding LytR/AlgR family response regulator
MQNLQVLLVEDDRSAALDVEMLFEEMGQKLAAIRDNADAALQYIYDEQPDIIIMDIELKGDKSGLDIAKEIDHLHIPTIFTTSYKDKQTYEQATKSTYSLGYLVKPFSKLSLQSMIEQAVKTMFPEDGLESPSDCLDEGMILANTVLVKHVNVLYPVRFDNILFIQGEGNYCSIHTNQRKFMLKMSLRKLLESVPANEFAPIHKSYIVRLDKVESIDIGSGKLTVGKEVLPLGRNFKNAFLERFNLLK